MFGMNTSEGEVAERRIRTTSPVPGNVPAKSSSNSDDPVGANVSISEIKTHGANVVVSERDC
jgi:hypothetical protein